MVAVTKVILSIYSPAEVEQTEVSRIIPLSFDSDANSGLAGETNSGQLVPFTGGTKLTLAPESERNATCIVAGNDRLDSENCTGDNSQIFTILT
jgi:hypothetical protein